MKKIYENPVFDLNEIEVIETSETQDQSAPFHPSRPSFLLGKNLPEAGKKDAGASGGTCQNAGSHLHRSAAL